MLQQNIKSDISRIFFLWRMLSLAFKKGELNVKLVAVQRWVDA